MVSNDIQVKVFENLQKLVYAINIVRKITFLCIQKSLTQVFLLLINHLKHPLYQG
jgi:hypothetical protein